MSRVLSGKIDNDKSVQLEGDLDHEMVFQNRLEISYKFDIMISFYKLTSQHFTKHCCLCYFP